MLGEQPENAERHALAEGERGKSRILLVEDDRALLQAMTRMLVANGLEVCACSDGVGAVEALSKHSFDAVITDIRMPQLGGLDLLRAIRRHDVHLPVIIVTGGPSVETAAEAVEQGAFRYFTKPVEFTVLRDAVERAISLYHLALAKNESLQTLNASSGLASDAVGLEMVFSNAIDSLWPAFQPIVSVATRDVFGYEVLMRTKEPSLPHPGAVLDAAMRLNQLPRLGKTLRQRAGEVLQRSVQGLTFFVNLHPDELHHPDLLDPNTDLFRNARRVVLEVTERAALDRVTGLPGQVKQLKDAGYRIAVDDLGAGYAGLTSFVQLEPDFVKLDMTLIRDVNASVVKQRIVRSMTDLCHDMNLQVVAEGIETLAERDTVVALGCDLLQGYLHGKPQPTLQGAAWGSRP